MLKKLREPVNSLTHWGGAILALIGLITLLIVGWDTPAKVISFAIYGVSLIFMFSASATYHMVRVKDKALEVFRKVDHAAIFVLIAGTYTPFCVNAFEGFWKWGMLTIIWSLALIGIVVKIFYIGAPRWLNAGIYVLMGWISVAAAGQVLRADARQDDFCADDVYRRVVLGRGDRWADVVRPGIIEEVGADALAFALQLDARRRRL